MVWRKPELLIFRNLLSTKEAERIKEIATPKVRYIGVVLLLHHSFYTILYRFIAGLRCENLIKVINLNADKSIQPLININTQLQTTPNDGVKSMKSGCLFKQHSHLPFIHR